MKKLIYLILTVLIVGCSDDDANGNPCLYNPTLTTSAVTNITETVATLNGVVSIVSENCEDPNNTEQGFVYGTTIQPTISNNKVIGYGNVTDMTTTLENLEPNTTYYVRTFLKNTFGEYYGNEVSFMTVFNDCPINFECSTATASDFLSLEGVNQEYQANVSQFGEPISDGLYQTQYGTYYYRWDFGFGYCLTVSCSDCSFIITTPDLCDCAQPINGGSNETPDPNFVLNSIQYSFNEIVNGLRSSSHNITRMTAQFGQYNNNVTPSLLNGVWSSSYQMFANIDLLEEIDVTCGYDPIPYHLGIAQIIEAYTFITLVDYVGDVPYSQANQFGDFPTPELDPGEDVYTAQIALLDTAISNLSQVSGENPQDLFYGFFDPDKWIAIANTLKLKAYLNLGNGAAISALLSQNIIDTVDEDFQFKYLSASPIFQENYPNGTGFYMSNGFFDFLNAGDAEAPFVETGIADPRLRYYIYRQRSSAPSGSNLPCAGQDIYDYCYVGNLYWGRDHGDDVGFPNDNARRSTWGVYPGGGAFDNNQFNRVDSQNTQTLNGEGINPIFLSSFTHFALAEAGLDLGVGVDSRALLEAGISLSMDKVTDFSGSLTTTDEDDETIDYAATSADINDYIARVLAEYDAASGNDAKLAIVIREWYIASWGNGIEPYNMYRRTGYPSLQTGVLPVGSFPRSFRYPQSEVSTNPNVDQTTADNQVFWDTNPPGFIN